MTTTKWKRMALRTFDCQVGQGINTDMRAVRKDYFLDHDHSAYVDQWDWERVITADQRNLEFLTDVVQRIWKVLRGAQTHAEELFPQLRDDRYPSPPEELTSMGVRVTKETLVKQLEMSGQMDFLDLPYHQAIMNDRIPLSIGGGIGQSGTYMYLPKKAHLGEVSVTVWPKVLKEISAEKNMHVLE